MTTLRTFASWRLCGEKFKTAKAQRRKKKRKEVDFLEAGIYSQNDPKY
jgi:hypothetical protein